jgi:hypothetical protein
MPLAAIAAVVMDLWPAARSRYGLTALIAAFFCTITVPLTTQAGENLLHRMPTDPLILAHARIGNQATAWTAIFGILFAVVIGMDIYRRSREGRLSKTETWVASKAGLEGGGTVGRSFRVSFRVAQALSIASAVGVVVVIALAGHSGAKAVWSHYPNLSSAPVGSGG